MIMSGMWEAAEVVLGKQTRSSRQCTIDMFEMVLIRQ